MDILSYILGKKAGGGGGEAVLINKSVTANGTYNASSDSADGYKKVEVAVPNSYGASDEGKVVSNGALVAQGSDTVTENDTYDTTLISELTVNVSGGVVTDYSSVLMGENQNGLFTFPGITKLRSNLFNGVGGSYSVESMELLEIQAYCFDGSSGLVGLRVPNCTMIGSYALRGTHQETLFAPSAILAANCANGNTYIKTAVIGGTPSNTGNFQFRNATALKTVDVVDGGRYDSTFNGCTVFDTLILRKQAVVPLQNVGTFASTCFDSGKTGGNIYIPKSLYDHLGDGTANDYKAATNWSTINGYGTITWHAIEGSQYENYYADGTPIT